MKALDLIYRRLIWIFEDADLVTVVVTVIVVLAFLEFLRILK